ncbi:MAG: hypothetical protein DRI79_07220 [Chloroflexi bacterium]|nr:MAG: hypothetical protein DRI79_07220 [Chloroflexota bacterium]
MAVGGRGVAVGGLDVAVGAIVGFPHALSSSTATNIRGIHIFLNIFPILLNIMIFGLYAG